MLPLLPFSQDVSRVRKLGRCSWKDSLIISRTAGPDGRRFSQEPMVVVDAAFMLACLLAVGPAYFRIIGMIEMQGWQERLCLNLRFSPRAQRATLFGTFLQ